jgi:KUP system potassium uptake protein
VNTESTSTSNSMPAAAPARHPAQWAKLAVLGVVFGDLGTSPLYTLQTLVQLVGGRFTPAGAVGILSLIVWTLIITISIKYCLFVMRADNRGEGGILALMSLIGANGFTRGARLLTGMGLLGAALIYGDGIITPAISVLSAVEGVNVATDTLKPFVMPMAVAILIGLFTWQRFGTQSIGRAFGPVMLLWFIVIAILGLFAIARHPQVLAALDPRRAVEFMTHSGAAAFWCWAVCFCASPVGRRCTPTWATSAKGRSAGPGARSCCRHFS